MYVWKSNHKIIYAYIVNANFTLLYKVRYTEVSPLKNVCYLGNFKWNHSFNDVIKSLYFIINVKVGIYLSDFCSNFTPKLLTNFDEFWYIDTIDVGEVYRLPIIAKFCDCYNYNFKGWNNSPKIRFPLEINRSAGAFPGLWQHGSWKCRRGGFYRVVSMRVLVTQWGLPHAFLVYTRCKSVKSCILKATLIKKGLK